MQRCTPANFNGMLAALPPNCRPTSQDQRKLFQDRIVALLDTYFFQLPPTLMASEFGVFSEKVNRNRPKGGRPRHVSMDTLIFALADLYGKETLSHIETLPVSESSRFVGFMDSCLSPLHGDTDMTGALGRRWRDLRKAIRAFPSANQNIEDKSARQPAPMTKYRRYPLATLADGSAAAAAVRPYQ